MSNARKLQTEIDRVMKKVDEGVEIFDEIWEKVYAAQNQNQKEKYEMDLKKEIKKLQRLRDQIKTWIGGSEVKDKEPLIEARKLIETKMEQFKICEKETKTKTYSKEGLAREEKLDPHEEAKLATTTWLQEFADKFQTLVEETDFEIENLSSGKGKKTNKNKIEDLNHHITNHKHHISKIEGIIRLVNNDRLDVETVDALKEDFEYYLESFEDDDYQAAYDEEFFYESLGLDDLDVVNVDRVTQPPPTKKTDDTSMTSSKGSGKAKSSKKSSVSSVIPLTIGRARSTKKDKNQLDDSAATTPAKPVRSPSSASSAKSDGSGSKAAQTPTPVPVTTPPAGGASMAAILKRETEQQEKERQKLLQEQQQRAQAEQLRQQEALKRQQEAALRQQQAQQEALKRQQQEAALRQQQDAVSVQGSVHSQEQNGQVLLPSQPVIGGNSMDILSSGLGGLGLGGPAPKLDAAPGAVKDEGVPYLSALNDAFATTPSLVDGERSRTYTPQNPYPTPASYPSVPSALFDNPAVFEKLGTDCLFFIFYYAQGTYQQYLAARELKKQSWRFHKKYMTWFQRHEEPKITTDDYEQGTYVYFDYEAGWCTRIKQDFRFEYSYLEDSLQ